jgi:hypothetical protein
MSGTPKGRIDCLQLSGLSSINSVSTTFVSFYKGLKLLETAGYIEEIANNYGTGSGFDYYDTASPIGTSGFYVFRFPPYGSRVYSLYFLVQYVSSGTLGTANNVKYNNSAANTYGNIGITFAACLDSGVDTNPWLGGTAKAGADAKANPAWGGPVGSELWLGNRTNASGGVNAATGSDTHRVSSDVNVSAYNIRYGIIADRDNILFYYDRGDLGYQINVVGSVMFEPTTEISSIYSIYHSAFRWRGSGEGWFEYTISNPTANASPDEINVPFTSSSYCKGGSYSSDKSVYNTFQPSTLTGKYQESTISVYSNEALNYGICGKLDTFMTSISNLNSCDTLNSKSRIILGSSVAAEMKMVFPWDGSSTPQSAVTDRDGIDF